MSPFLRSERGRGRAVPAGPSAESRFLQPYIVLVVATAAVLLINGVPRAEFAHPLLFVTLLIGSMTAAVLKIHLPLASGQATLSMSYFTDFLSLVLLGPHEGMLVAGASAESRSRSRTRERPALSPACPRAAVMPPLKRREPSRANRST